MCVVTGGTDIEWLLKGEYGKTCYSWAIWKKKKKHSYIEIDKKFWMNWYKCLSMLLSKWQVGGVLLKTQ